MKIKLNKLNKHNENKNYLNLKIKLKCFGINSVFLYFTTIPNKENCYFYL